MSPERRDITQLPDLTTGEGRVGPVRTRMPIYVDLLPPCNNACPAGENCQEWLRLVKETDPESAWRQLVRDNPFPAIHGRVCYHPCETACNRGDLDSAVSIHSVERYLGDLAIEKGWGFDKPRNNSGFRILVIGAGPAGLSAAYHLARLGHEVEIHDAGSQAGGMMRYGIPEYRLPRDVVDAEIKRVESLGVKIELNHHVKDLVAEQKSGHFDAVFVAVGAHLSRRVEIPSMDAGHMVDAVDFLRNVASGDKPVIGRRVAVYGGGNTAMDAARTARRLGAEDAVIIYRRTENEMPAHKEELEEAEREGVQVHWLRTINEMQQGDIKVEIMELDKDGKPHGTGKYETLAADTVIMAVGQVADTGFLHDIPGMQFNGDVVKVDPTTLMTDVPGIFAGGDAVPSERTVTVGVGHGKRAAKQIDTWLNHQNPQTKVKHPIVHFDDLHLWYFGDHPREVQPELDPAARVSDFDEVVKGLSADEAIFEATRCLSCGNCFECDGCYGSCPEDAIVKLGKGHRYRFDYDKCTGCGTCFEQCPVHAIEMIPEK
ncbi:NAD(P)-binding protein [Propionibacterium freudenreichii]|uniref:FAD-dependent pyridine nucleotide-disulphide oxidoreductase:4Fe-4S ferredoxin, iron-sulfur binding:Aromatic-ring hydroxylase n=1 Tax=Propionibacterium freudenreichii subsp. freudenreichii TaxID=66712 RepID=A0A0B7NXK9_PROFF|nr:NAD(P)-binding protein [Propionibacterium freudenreichii]AJQ89917.1 TRNA uridine 5-carboxymethylaminomethyl modification enzyme GidA [Propionibacterium freudenreichii subsp. freudenreichii]MCT2996009.1 FAD-dependent oxidoreductase [Propionibacterium freudenreichii]MCT3001125.1 FAD-dependent oxidoreductase [Propionibacterium freudenreichii]MCT3015567.1 FAD-dependent oxidoreductase [Propionibacterium freudenreichii]MDK9302715.1 NAD(P)-binding protein [Propionibacterium freudenreichii]